MAVFFSLYLLVYLLIYLFGGFGFGFGTSTSAVNECVMCVCACARTAQWLLSLLYSAGPRLAGTSHTSSHQHHVGCSTHRRVRRRSHIRGRVAVAFGLHGWLYRCIDGCSAQNLPFSLLPIIQLSIHLFSRRHLPPPPSRTVTSNSLPSESCNPGRMTPFLSDPHRCP